MVKSFQLEAFKHLVYSSRFIIVGFEFAVLNRPVGRFHIDFCDDVYALETYTDSHENWYQTVFFCTVSSCEKLD
jgi:hypothetical protein